MKRMYFILFVFLSLATVSEAQSESAKDYGMTIPIKFYRAIAAIYRKTTKEELEIIKPNPEDKTKYSEFLRQPNTGLIRLMRDLGCAENVRVVVAAEDCQKFTMPGAGSSYSFRTKDYRIQRLADITFSKNRLYTDGILTHSILTDIGDVALDRVDLEDNSLSFLIGFQPAADYEQADIISAELNKGITSGGRTYQNAANVLENTTYILRSIAYNGERRRAVNGITYNELAFDKRKDSITAFRIVRKEADGSSITILWKKLREKDAPKIEPKKTQKIISK